MCIEMFVISADEVIYISECEIEFFSKGYVSRFVNIMDVLKYQDLHKHYGQLKYNILANEGCLLCVCVYVC